jgi:hypothetical protein
MERWMFRSSGPSCRSRKEDGRWISGAREAGRAALLTESRRAGESGPDDAGGIATGGDSDGGLMLGGRQLKGRRQKAARAACVADKGEGACVNGGGRWKEVEMSERRAEQSGQQARSRGRPASYSTIRGAAAARPGAQRTGEDLLPFPLLGAMGRPYRFCFLFSLPPARLA